MPYEDEDCWYFHQDLTCPHYFFHGDFNYSSSYCFSHAIKKQDTTKLLKKDNIIFVQTQKIKDLKISLELYEKSIFYYLKIKDNNIDIAECYINCAILYPKTEYIKILDFYFKAINIYISFNDNDKLIKYYENISDIYYLNNDYDNTVLYLNKVIEYINKKDIYTYEIILKQEELLYKIGIIYCNNLNNFDNIIKLYTDYVLILDKSLKSIIFMQSEHR